LTDEPGLPYQSEPNTGFGILAKTYLDVVIYHYGDTVAEEDMLGEKSKGSKKQALEFVESSFGSVKTPVAEVERGFRFWDAVRVSSKLLCLLVWMCSRC